MAWPPLPARFASTLFVAACLWGSPAFATIVVTNTNDSGKGSLRNAILLANAAPGPESITFKLLGTPPHVISPLSPLPPVTNTVAIIGTASGKRLDVVLDGSQAGPGCGLDLRGQGSRVQSLVLNGWWPCGILLAGQGGHKVDDNRIGTDARGRQAVANQTGITVVSSDNQIGVNGPNLVSGNEWEQISIQGGSRNHVQGNTIGPNVSGQHIGAAAGIYIGHATRTTVTSNVIVVGIVGISLQLTSSNVIVANTIRVAAVPYGYGYGIVLGYDANDNVIGSHVAGGENTIAMAHVPAVGVVVSDGAHGNSIRGNRIHDLGRGCPDELGNLRPNAPCLAIDLIPLDPTPNDLRDADSGANNLQNSPRIVDAFSNGLTTQIVGELESRPSSSYAVDVYTSPVDTGTGSCEMRAYLGTTSFMTDITGRAVFFFSTPTPVALGHSVGATATALTGATDTSEVSPCRLVRGGQLP